MSERIEQSPRDHYERPNCRWTCGRGALGCPCNVGPDSRGRCVSTTRCQPVHDGERWNCTLSSIGGGPCQDGPMPDGTCCEQVLPCRPVQNIRWWRRRFTLGCSALVLGILLIGISGPRRDAFLSPGDLTSSHAGAVSAHDCTACHDAAEHRAGGWVARWLGKSDVAVGGSGTAINPKSPVQSAKCMVCHEKEIDPHWARSAHSLPVDQLAELTIAKRNHRDGMGGLFGDARRNMGDIECATCHREHHGSSHDLAAMTNQQCQTCHAESFESFAAGHPDFGDWPFARRTRIAFDHASHQNLHFDAANQKFDCRRCHLDGANQSGMRLAGFDQSCASCHDESIQERSSAGIRLLALPTIDVELLEQTGHPVGAWPTAAHGWFDGTIPPLMQLLLAADPEVARAMEQFAPDMDLSLIDEHDASQLEAVAIVANGIRELMFELRDAPESALQRRIELALDRDVQSDELREMIRRTPEPLFAAVAQSWFPSESVGISSLPAEAHVQPVGRGAPSSLVSSMRHPSQQDDTSEWLADNPLTQRYANGSTDPPPDQGPTVGQGDGTTDPVNPHGDPDADNQLSPQGDATTDSSDADSSLENPAPQVVHHLLPSGDWNYDGERLTLAYYPTGHEDALVKEWIELVCNTRPDGRSDSVRRALDYFTNENSPGRCTDCHSVDSAESIVDWSQIETNASLTSEFSRALRDVSASTGWVVHWNAKSGEENRRGFTRFSHRPHLILSELSDCTGCHQVDSGASIKLSYGDRHPYGQSSGFLPIRKANCVECHRTGFASDGCTTCHQYHVESHWAGSRQ